MAKNTPKPPKPNLEKKPLDKEGEKAKAKQELSQRIKAEKESLLSEILTRVVINKRIVTGVGNEADYYEELIEGFKQTLSAKGINLGPELEKQIKENGGRLIPKENRPIIRDLTKKYGVVPKQ